MTEAERRGMSTLEVALPPPVSCQGMPQESLVLQVYGITAASRDFKERLQGTIQRKLEATTLDILCSLYARNQNLKLSPEDVAFLQSDFRKPSLTFHLPLPDWLGHSYREAFFFYFLQMLSTFTLMPAYSSIDRTEHHQFQAHTDLQNAYQTAGLGIESASDHLLLYIRPQTKGRAMAVLCVSLADSMGRVVVPFQGHTTPLKFEDSYFARMEEECVVNEQLVFTGRSSIKVHVWDKGSIGVEEFMQRLNVSYRQSMCDYFLEVYLLSSPLVRWKTVEEHNWSSPSLITREVAEEGQVDTPQSVHQQVANVSQLSSENPYKRSSEILPRQDSGNSSRRGSDNFSLCAFESSSCQGLNSSRSSLTYSESRWTSAVHGRCLGLEKVSQPLPRWRQERSRQFSYDNTFNKLEETEHLYSSTLSPTVMGRGLEVSEGVKKSSEGGGDSLQARLVADKGGPVEARQAVMKDADLSKNSILSEIYTTTISAHLSVAQQAACPSIRHLCLPLLGHHSTQVFVSQVVATLSHLLPELTSSVFQHTPSGYIHYIPEKDWTKVKKKADASLQGTAFIIIARNLAQWEYCRRDGQVTPADTPESFSGQYFNGLGSKYTASSSSEHAPLQCAALAKNVFVPRRRMVYLRVTHYQVRDDTTCELTLGHSSLFYCNNRSMGWS